MTNSVLPQLFIHQHFFHVFSSFNISRDQNHTHKNKRSTNRSGAIHNIKSLFCDMQSHKLTPCRKRLDDASIMLWLQLYITHSNILTVQTAALSSFRNISLTDYYQMIYCMLLFLRL